MVPFHHYRHAIIWYRASLIVRLKDFTLLWNQCSMDYRIKISNFCPTSIPGFPWNCENNLRIAGSSPSWPICNLCNRSFLKLPRPLWNCNIRAEWLVEKISFLVFIFSRVQFLLFRITPERKNQRRRFQRNFYRYLSEIFLSIRNSWTVWDVRREDWGLTDETP